VEGVSERQERSIGFFCNFCARKPFFAVSCGFWGFPEVFESRRVFGSKLIDQKYSGGNTLGPNLR